MVVNNSTGSKVDKLRKWIHRVFKSLHLKVKINSNIKQVDFLDVTLNLHLNNFQPFLKNNANPIYINPTLIPITQRQLLNIFHHLLNAV